MYLSSMDGGKHTLKYSMVLGLTLCRGGREGRCPLAGAVGFSAKFHPRGFVHTLGPVLLFPSFISRMMRIFPPTKTCCETVNSGTIQNILFCLLWLDSPDDKRGCDLS